jgi:dihydrofolate reductase
MAKLIFGMNQSLDGYVDHMAFGPAPGLFRHFIEQTRQRPGAIYGRRMYEIMRYWDDNQEGWGAPEAEFAQAWRAQRKHVVSSTLTEVGPNAELVRGDLKSAIEVIKSQSAGDLEVAGPVLARGLDELGLVDEFQIYLHPVVTGGGTPFFGHARKPLTLVATDRFDGGVVRLTYSVP